MRPDKTARIYKQNVYVKLAGALKSRRVGPKAALLFPSMLAAIWFIRLSNPPRSSQTTCAPSLAPRLRMPVHPNRQFEIRGGI